MMLSNKNRKNIKYYLPIVIFLYSVLVMYIKKVTYDFSAFPWIRDEKIVYDLFSYFKGRAIIWAAIIAILIFVFEYIVNGIDIKKIGKKYVLFWIFSFFIILSFLTSDYKTIALIGFFERHEGLFVSLSYIIMSVYTAYVLKEEKIELSNLITIILVLAGILGVIGTLQYFKIDIFRMPWFRRFLIDPVLGESANINFELPEGRVYLTVYNPNYVGVIMSIFIMIATNVLIFDKSKVNKGLSLIILPLLIISLLGSYSRGGMIAIAVGMIVLVLVNFKYVFKHKIAFLIAILVMGSAVVVVNRQMNDFIKNRFINILKIEKQEYNGLKEIDTSENTIRIKYNDNEYLIERDDVSTLGLVLKTEEGYISPVVKDKKYVFEYKELENITIALGEYNKRPFWQFVIDNKKWNFSDQDQEIKYINDFGKLTILENAPSWKPLEGYENIGSGRGYIWSRTIPLINDKFITGYGPDTYALAFPQEDYIYKLKIFRNRNMIVDKPHNLYLQYLVNYGVPATLLFLAILFLVLWKNLRNYEEDVLKRSLVISTLIVIIVVSFFNDSTVSTSPLIWTCIGLGYSNVA